MRQQRPSLDIRKEGGTEGQEGQEQPVSWSSSRRYLDAVYGMSKVHELVHVAFGPHQDYRRQAPSGAFLVVLRQARETTRGARNEEITGTPDAYIYWLA